MKTEIAKLLGAALPAGIVPADVAPPTGLIVSISLGVIIILGILVAVIVVVAILVIRAIRRNSSAKKE